MSVYHNHKNVFPANIRTLLYSLVPSTYDEVAPKIEFWIEYGLSEQFTTIEDLVEQLSSVAWNIPIERSDVPRFLKEFRDAPHRSEQARSLVDELCLRVLRWFAATSANDSLQMKNYGGATAEGGGDGFVRVASFVGHSIKCGLFSHELVRCHLAKPLIHHNQNGYNVNPAVRASVIYQLFATAGNALLQGLLEPKDVRACFEILNRTSGIVGLNTARLDELREIHATWLQHKEEEDQRNATAAEAPVAEVDTPLAFVPQDLPATQIDVDPPSPTLQGIVSASILQDVEFPPETFVNIPSTAASSPTLSISTVSDLTPTEFGEDFEGGGGEQVTAPHETFYFEDGNVEVVCGHTLFRIHSTTVSFSSPKLREMLSRSALLHAPMSEGCPRITIEDSSQDFAVLLKMIYTPGFPAWRKVPEFTVFGSLLRMTTKYGFSDVRDQLLDSIKTAYPTKREGSGIAKVLGEDIFGSPKPHPNAVLNLFTEQGTKFALPFAAYRAGLGGFSSLTSDKPGTVLPRLALASTIYGMEMIRGGLARLAHSAVFDLSLKECRDGACAVESSSPPKRRKEALNQIYDFMVREGKGDVLSCDLSLGIIVCANCAKTPEKTYRVWRAVIWEELPRIFGVGKSWEEV